MIIFFFVAVVSSLVVEAQQYAITLSNRRDIVKNLLDLQKDNSSIQDKLTDLKASEKPAGRTLFYRSPKKQKDCMLTQLVYLSGTDDPEGIGVNSVYRIKKIEGMVNNQQAVFELDPWQETERKPVSNNFLVSAKGSRKLVKGVVNSLFADQREAVEDRDAKWQQARWCVYLTLGLLGGIVFITYKYGRVDQLVKQKIGRTFLGMSILIWWLISMVVLGPLGLAVALAESAQNAEKLREKITQRMDIMKVWLEQNPITCNADQET